MNKSRLLIELASEGIAITGVVEKAEDEKFGYFVYISVSRGKDGSQSPTNYKLTQIVNKLQEQGINIDFIISDEIGNDIESGLRATLLVKYPEQIRNVFISLDSNYANVWIDPKSNAHEYSNDIEDSVRQYLKEVKLLLKALLFTTNENLPTAFTILKTLRICAPATLNEISARLQANGLTVPSCDWLRRKLESSRRKGHIVWLKDPIEDGKAHSYALTLQALKALGTEKNRTSPDITRLLAISKNAK